MIVYLVFILIKFMAIRKISFEITKPIIVDPIDANGKKNFKKEFLTNTKKGITIFLIVWAIGMLFLSQLVGNPFGNISY